MQGSEAKYYLYNMAVRPFATNSWYHNMDRAPRCMAHRCRGGLMAQAMKNTRFYSASNAPQLYERYTVPNWTLPQTELMFAHVSLHAGDRGLDAACGQ